MRTHQRSYAGGVIAEEMFGRFDLNNYQTGAAIMLNIYPQPHGPAVNRCGLEHIKECKDGGPNPVRIFPFKFNPQQAHIIEVGDVYSRFINEGGTGIEASKVITAATQANPVQLTVTTHGYDNDDEIFASSIVGMTDLNNRFYKIKNKTANTFELTDLQGNNIDGTAFGAYVSGGLSSRVYTITSPYGHADLFDIRFDQQEDIMSLAHGDYAPRELQRIAATNWNFANVVLVPSVDRPTNISLTRVGSGGDWHFYVVTALSEDLLEESLPSRGKAISGITQANPAVVTSTAHGFSNADRVWTDEILGMTELNNRFFEIANVTANTYELVGEDSTSHTAYISGGYGKKGIQNTLSTAGNKNTVAWDKVADTIRYNVYKQENGLFGFIGQTAALSFDDDNFDADELLTPPIDQQPFASANNFPRAVGHSNQRRVFGSTINLPGSSWMTRSGTESNLTKSIPNKDNDALAFRLKHSEYLTVQHYITLDDLLVFTSAAEIKISPGNAQALTPSSIDDKAISYIGSSILKPIVAGDAIVFVQELGGKIFDLKFRPSNIEKKTPGEISIIAPDLFEGFTIVDWAYSKVPEPRIWAVRSDGKALSLTYMSDQSPAIVGWALHETNNGTFESVAVVPEANGEESVYFVVKRDVNGVERRFIERLHSREFSSIQDAFFVDAGKTIDNPITITGATQADPVVITAASHGVANGQKFRVSDMDFGTDIHGNAFGMSELEGKTFTASAVTTNTIALQTDDDTPVDVDGTAYGEYTKNGKLRVEMTEVTEAWHLEGRTVAILADGHVHPKRTVTNGKFTLETGASRIHYGEPIRADFKTLPLVLQLPGFGAGRFKSVSDIYMRVHESRGFLAGPDENNLVKKFLRTTEDYGSPTLPKSKEVFLNIKPSAWGPDGTVFIRQDDPVPLSILSMALEVKASV